MTTSTDFFILPDDPPSKRAILKAALKLFVQDGYWAINVRAIAAEAGYTNPALFKFFKSKEELGLYLFRSCYLRYAAVFAASTKSDRSFEENLETILRAFFKVIDESPEAFLFVQDHLRQFWAQLPSEVRKQSILRQIQRLIEQGQRDREVTGTLSPRILVAAFVGFLTQLARMLHFNEFGDAADWQREAMIVAKKIFRR